MIATRNPWAAREWVEDRLRDIKTVSRSKEQSDTACIALAAEIDAALGQAISEHEDGQALAYESAKHYLLERLG